AVVQPRWEREQLDQKLDEAGKAKGTVLEGPVAILQPRADDARAGQAEQRVEQRARRAGVGARVGIQQVYGTGSRFRVPGVSEAQPAQGEVVRSGEAEVAVTRDQL